MSKIKEKKLVIVAYLSLAVAILSSLTTIVGYENSSGIYRSFSIIDMITDARGFGVFVFGEYTGPAVTVYQNWHLFILIALAAAAITCAIVGLFCLSNQTDNKLSFILTLFGLIGTMIPSVIVFICIVALKDLYHGTISCGIYPILSPIAMTVCLIAATKMRRRNVRARKRMKEAEGLIFKAGDL